VSVLLSEGESVAEMLDEEETETEPVELSDRAALGDGTTVSVADNDSEALSESRRDGDGEPDVDGDPLPDRVGSAEDEDAREAVNLVDAVSATDAVEDGLPTTEYVVDTELETEMVGAIVTVGEMEVTGVTVVVGDVAGVSDVSREALLTSDAVTFAEDVTEMVENSVTLGDDEDDALGRADRDTDAERVAFKLPVATEAEPVREGVGLTEPDALVECEPDTLPLRAGERVTLVHVVGVAPAMGDADECALCETDAHALVDAEAGAEREGETEEAIVADVLGDTL
jgi:hypothetical protein